MTRFMAAVAVLLACASMASAGKQSLPKSVVVARYVMVTSYFGNGVADPNVPADDRQAIADVEKAISTWGKYRLVYRAENADLIVLVRKGRTAMVTPGVHIGTGVGVDSRNGRGGIQIGGGNDTRTGVSANAEAGSPDDMLAVYDAFHGIDSPPLWRKTMHDGLIPPSMQLVKEFRQAEEQTAKRP